MKTLVHLGAAISLLTINGCVTPKPSPPSALCGIRDLDGPPIPENFTELASAMEGEEEGEQAAFTLAPPKAQVEELAAPAPKRGPGRPAVANKAMATPAPAPAAAKGGKRPVKF